MNRLKKRIVYGIFSVVLIILTLPRPLFAYVDPGIIGMLFQAGFAIIFGFLLVIVTKPFKMIRSLYRKLRGIKSEPDENDSDKIEDDPGQKNNE
jgi:hypothetical protein